LVADWLASSGADRSCAWVSLDARDSDPVVYWRYVIAALRVAVPGFAATGRQMMEFERVPLDAALATLVSDLGGWTGEFVSSRRHAIDPGDFGRP
jgi:LuxR family maltose regulon positive regulatory protein